MSPNLKLTIERLLSRLYLVAHFFIGLSLFLTFKVQGQISESWNLTIESYSHNSSTYAVNNPPIEIASFSNDDKVILSQNGSLVKVNSEGSIIWQEKKSNCVGKRIVVDINDHIILSCGSVITKMDAHGKTIWEI